MAKSFLDSVKNVNNIRNLNELSNLNPDNTKKETAIIEKDVINHKTNLEKGKPGRKPIRRAIYIKRTIELREDQLEKLDKLAYDNRTSKREEIEKAIDLYFKSIKYWQYWIKQYNM